MTQCFPLAQGRRMRVTRVDNCGNLVTGACSQVTSSGFVSVGISSDVQDGTAINPLNANGDLCYQIRSKDQFLRHTLEMEFCEVDPDLFGLVTNVNSVEDFNEETVGIQTLEGAAEFGYALEVWMGVPGQECPDEGEASLGYLLLPWVAPGVLGDFTVQNDAINLTVGGFTQSGGNWGVGPYDVVPTDAMHTPGPLLDPIGPLVHAHLQWTSVAAPDAVCGCQAVS